MRPISPCCGLPLHDSPPFRPQILYSSFCAVCCTLTCGGVSCPCSCRLPLPVLLFRLIRFISDRLIIPHLPLLPGHIHEYIIPVPLEIVTLAAFRYKQLPAVKTRPSTAAGASQAAPTVLIVVSVSACTATMWRFSASGSYLSGRSGCIVNHHNQNRPCQRSCFRLQRFCFPFP